MLTDISTSLEFSKKEKLFTELKKYIGKSKKVLVAVSGGVDSMLVSCLLYGFFVDEKLNLENLKFVHLNHGVRVESGSEELFIKEFFGNYIDIIQNKFSNNTEESMRNWRYKQFDKLCNEKNIDFFVTGHHLNDRVESTFLHMLRGSGLRGFLSMQFCETHHLLNSSKILRPLLGLNKGEILSIIKQYDIPFVQDLSNFDPDVSKRNRLRNAVLPQIFELAHKNTDTENSFLTSIQKVYDELESIDVFNQDGGVSKTLFCNTIDIKMSPHRNAEWAYRLECFEGEMKTEYLLEILDCLNVAQNVTNKNLTEIVKFFNNNDSGHKFLNGVTFFVAHGKKYMIKAERHFWEKEVEDTDIQYPKEGYKYKGKTRNQFCKKQKIPVFWRNFIPVRVVEGEIVGYELEKDSY